MEEQANKWPKKITVDKRIVSVLSQSTYDNFPKALKELITNSYDADAKTVDITVDLNKETVIIHDTGRGMSASDFEFYLRIAGKTRKKEDNETPLGRQIIGQFGVGFLAVFPFFKSYTIETKKIGTSEVLWANIPLSRYFSDEKKVVDVGNILIDGGIRNEKDKVNISYTTITLKGFNELTRSFFYPRLLNKKNKIDKNLVETYDGISKLKWLLSDDLPIKFKEERFNEIFSLQNEPQFDVSVNDIPLHRNMYGDEILETHKGEYKQIGRIKVKYCIVTPRKSVKPYEARYFKIRNLNVGVGDQRENFGTAHGATRSRLHWLTGEIHIMEGMNDLIKISRDGFNYSSDYEDLKVYFNSLLNYYSNRLEDEAELEREIKQTGKEFRVSNVNLLNPENITRKLKKYTDAGYKLKQGGNKKSDVAINDQNKEIYIPKGFETIEKHIIINKKKYRVKSARWDFKSEKFPACKVEGNVITLNTSYPLFQGKKYTDIFVKLHLLLLLNYQDESIKLSTYKKLMDEILVYYSDYNK